MGAEEDGEKREGRAKEGEREAKRRGRRGLKLVT